MQTKSLKKILLFISITFAGRVLAVPPPDFIIQIASQLASFFTIGIAIFSALFATGYQFLQIYIQKHSKIFWLSTITIILILSFLSAITLNQYYRDQIQKNQNIQWMEESKSQNIFFPKEDSETATTLPTPSENIVTEEVKIEEPDYFSLHEKEGLMVTNEELQKIMKESNQKPFILDAREDLEFEIGHIPESTHIRFADLRVGRSKELPKNTPIYVLCWSGIRGKEVAEYLRTQSIFAKYLEKGVDSWVTFGGNWEGEIKFSHIFNKKNYQQVFSTTEVRKYIKEGVILVDSREPEKFQSKHIAGATNIPLMSTPTDKITEVFGKIGIGQRIIVICDDYVNCFDAKMTGIELERRGAIFLGRYNKPWEF